MPKNRTLLIYSLLCLGWFLMAGWQVIEHRNARESARAKLLDRAHDISRSVSAVVRSQSRGGLVPQPRLQAALDELARSTDLQSVSLLNNDGETVAHAGETITLDILALRKDPSLGESEDYKVFLNAVDLGTSGPKMIVMASSEDRPTSWPTSLSIGATSEALRQLWSRYQGRGDGRGGGGGGRDGRDETDRPPGSDGPKARPDGGGGGSRDGRGEVDRPPGPDGFKGRSDGGGGFHRSRGSGRNFGRPPWITKERYEELAQSQGLFGFALVLSKESMQTELARDFWLRLFLSVITFVAAAGLGLAWRNVDRSAQLQVRLVRASAMNSHLRELNLAAAGLAHETRNPLNIVRGLAQLISRHDEATDEIQSKATTIAEEVDRVTGRLNEFIDYSKPREARPAPTLINDVVRDVERALESDKEDKELEFDLIGPELTVEADESLLRQVLFNLLLNSIQAVGDNGSVAVRIAKTSADEACFEVLDDGPGVPPEARGEIFRPYFTTHDQGTGLGLAVVRQIVLAHHWEIDYIPSDDGGALFRVSGLRVTQKA